MRVLVVDDEPIARKRLIRMLGKLPEVEIAGEAADGVEALKEIARTKPDAVFLDIRMPGLDGLTLAGSVPQLPPVVFVTAYDEYAVKAFEAQAADYLMKPVEMERLAHTVDRLRARKPMSPEGLDNILRQIAHPEDDPASRIHARSGDTIRMFNARVLTRFYAADKYTGFQADGAEYLLDDSLNALESRLAPYGFLRVHRGELVNLRSVVAVHTDDDATSVELSDGQVAAVSRRSLGELKRRLGIR